jgi:hypothetical protein
MINILLIIILLIKINLQYNNNTIDILKLMIIIYNH